MGWSFIYAATTRAKLREYLDSPSHLPPGGKCIAAKMVGTNYWRVCETADGERFIALDLTAYDKHDACYGYKDLCESMGPCECDCPLSFLDMVPEPERNYGWRDAVRAYHAAKAARAVLAPGMVMLHGNGERYELREYQGRRGWIITRCHDGARMRMPANRMRELEPYVHPETLPAPIGAAVTCPAPAAMQLALL